MTMVLAVPVDGAFTVPIAMTVAFEAHHRRGGCVKIHVLSAPMDDVKMVASDQRLGLARSVRIVWIVVPVHSLRRLQFVPTHATKNSSYWVSTL